MKFKKGMNESVLWEFLHFNIFDYFDNRDKSLVDYSKQNIIDKLKFKDGKLKKDIEIIIKINGKVQPDCWQDSK